MSETTPSPLVTPRAHEPSAPARLRRGALASLAMSMLLASLGTNIANVALPTLAQAFDASFQQVQWVLLSYMLAITILIVSVGKLGDLLGHRRVLLGGLVLYTFASVLCGLAPSLSMLIAARALQGLGGAVLMALSMAMVRETVTAEKTGSAMGLLATMSATGTALGPAMGGVLIAVIGWRATFLVIVPIGLVCMALAVLYLPRVQREKAPERARFDMLGTVLLAATLAAYALAMTVGGGSFGTLNIALIGVALIGVVIFTVSQGRVAAPLISLEAFRDSRFTASLVSLTLVMTVVSATMVVGPFYLSRGLGLSEALVGIVLASGPMMSAVTGYPSGLVVDRFGPRRMILIGLASVLVGMLALAVLPNRFGIVGYIGAVLLYTPGYQLFQASNNTSMMIDVAAERRGVISGMLNLARNIGSITGAALMGAIFAFAAGTTNIVTADPPAIARAMWVTFLTAAAVMVVALVLVIWGNARAAAGER